MFISSKIVYYNFILVTAKTVGVTGTIGTILIIDTIVRQLNFLLRKTIIIINIIKISYLSTDE